MVNPIWDAVLSPARSVEVRAWLSKEANHQTARDLRGPQGETLLHWAALSDLGLMLDLVGLGVDVNAVDQSGRSPMDWQFERLWATHVENVGNLTHYNRQKLRLVTDDLLSTLWRQGGRPQSDMLEIRGLAVRCGLWKTLATWVDLEGPAALRNWSHPGEGPTHAIHHWPLAPADKGREFLLELWLNQGWPLDEPNPQGHSALWVAVKERLAATGFQALGLDAAIEALVAAGANVTFEGPDGISLQQLPLLSNAPEEVVQAIEVRLSTKPKVSPSV